jgi:hypothetical protein
LDVLTMSDPRQRNPRRAAGLGRVRRRRRIYRITTPSGRQFTRTSTGPGSAVAAVKAEFRASARTVLDPAYPVHPQTRTEWRALLEELECSDWSVEPLPLRGYPRVLLRMARGV